MTIAGKPLPHESARGHVTGAALYTDDLLWRFPNVILTPHISGAYRSAEFPRRLADLFTQNVQRFLQDRPLLNEITPQEWREA